MGRQTILNKIAQFILTGGRRTTAAGTRDVLNEMAYTYVSCIYDTAANFTANNPILETKQIGVETDDLVTVPKFKIGDGVNDWNTLPYFAEQTGGGTWGLITGTLSNQTDLQSALNAKEDTLNKTSTVTGNESSTSKYLTVKGVYDWVTSLFVKKGTLTTNYIPKATASDTIGNSTIYDNGDVGIGTTTTTLGKLTVQPTTSENAIVIKNSGNDAILDFNMNGIDRAKIWVDNTNSFLNFYTVNNNTVFWNGIGAAQVKTIELTYDNKINTPTLTASKIVETDASKNLTSSSYAVSDLLPKRTTVGDANYTILTTDKEIVTSATLTNNRTYTLPTGETAGQEFIVADEFQALGTYTITVGVATGKKLNGVTNGTVTMVTVGGHRRFFGDGNGNYSFDAGLARLGVSQTFTGTNTFSTAPVLSSLTASQLLATDGSKNIQTLTTATYPSLTELSYTKGVTSAIQTQIDGKLTTSNNLSDLSNLITARTTNLRMWDLFLTNGDQSTTSSSASNITDLVSVSLTANKRYKIHGIIHVSCNNTGGVKIQVTIPTGATIFLMTNGFTSGSSVNAWSAINASATLGAAFCTVNSTNGCIMVNGEVSLSSTAGTIQFGFASGVNTQTSTIYQLGTQIILTQIN